MAREPDSLCYIYAGEGIVYEPNSGKYLARIAKGTLFGESYLSKKVSYQTAGEIRSGIRPMKLLKFSYEDVSRVLTYTEMEILRALEVRPEVERIIYEQAEIRNIDPKKVLHY